MIELVATPGSLRASLIREQVIDLLRDAILAMRIKPGEQLIERELVEQLGVSRATIREALRQLSAEGLIRTVPQKGAVVPVPTRKEIEELYEIRARLEGLVAKQFAERATEADIADLAAALAELANATHNPPDVTGLLLAKDRFYTVLFAGSHNDIARDMIGSLQARMRVARYISLSRPDRPGEVVAELAEVVDAIQARNVDAAERASERHIRLAAENVLRALPTWEPQDVEAALKLIVNPNPPVRTD